MQAQNQAIDIDSLSVDDLTPYAQDAPCGSRLVGGGPLDQLDLHSAWHVEKAVSDRKKQPILLDFL